MNLIDRVNHSVIITLCKLGNTIATRMIPVHPSSLVTHDDRGLELHLSRETRVALTMVDDDFVAVAVVVVACARAVVVVEPDDLG